MEIFIVVYFKSLIYTFMKKLLFVILIAVSFLSCSKDQDPEPVPTTGTLRINLINNSKIDKSNSVTLYLKKREDGVLDGELFDTDVIVKANTSQIVDLGELLPGYYYYSVTGHYAQIVMIKAGNDKIVDVIN